MKVVKTFPMLLKKNSRGAISEWEISVQEEVSGKKANGAVFLVSEHGQSGGKKIKDTKEIKKGKNIGKINETSVVAQAISVAESKWNKQKDRGYRETIDNKNIIIRPMLAQKYKDRKKYLKFPAVVQPKYDGVRFNAYLENGYVKMVSRLGKEFLCFGHLLPALQKILSKHDIVLDGEVYSDVIPFQRLVGLVRKKELKDEEDIRDMQTVHIRLYDCIDLSDFNSPFNARYAIIKNICRKICPDIYQIRLVENKIIEDESEISKIHSEVVSEGYEGIMLRNLDGVYGINKRSNDLLKYKEFDDAEFKIIGAKEGEGRDQGTVVWICATASGEAFSVRPRGDITERRDWWAHYKFYINKFLTVRYFGLTDSGIPRFPVGIEIRDYE